MTNRSDKKKSIDKVAASLAKNPLQSEREIAKDSGVSKSAVNRAKQEVGQVGAKDDRIVSLTDGDFDLMKKIQLEKFRRMEEEREQLNNSDIDRWENTASKRYSLFRGTATDESGGLKEVNLTPDVLKAMSNEEMNERRKALLDNG